jgi:hypothetical protein
MADVTIIALFDRPADAERAAQRLRGEVAADVAVHAGEPGAGDAGAGRLAGLPAEDHAFCREGLRRGGVPVSVVASRATITRVVAILGECGAADLDAREADWRAEGWTGQATDTGYTGHDEDIGFATYGGDAVIRRIPRRHHDDMPAGLLGRLEMAAMEDAPETPARHARVYGRREETGGASR